MGKLNTHYGLATWVVLGHQFKDNQIPFGCTCMRLAKSYLEFLSKNANPGGLLESVESDSPETFISSHHIFPFAPENLVILSSFSSSSSLFNPSPIPGTVSS